MGESNKTYSIYSNHKCVGEGYDFSSILHNELPPPLPFQRFFCCCLLRNVGFYYQLISLNDYRRLSQLIRQMQYVAVLEISFLCVFYVRFFCVSPTFAWQSDCPFFIPVILIMYVSVAVTDSQTVLDCGLLIKIWLSRSICERDCFSRSPFQQKSKQPFVGK